MSEQRVFRLAAASRSIIGKKVKQLRQQGWLPAVIYGADQPAQNIQTKTTEFTLVAAAAGSSSLIDLVIDKCQPTKVLLTEIVYHPVTNQSIHIDFYRVKMTEKIHAEIPLKFTGEAPVVKELGGNLIIIKDTLECEALPGDLVHDIEVDLDGLSEFGQTIHLKDIKLPSGIALVGDLTEIGEEVIVSIEAPRSEEELKELEEEKPAEEEQKAVEELAKETEKEGEVGVTEEATEATG